MPKICQRTARDCWSGRCARGLRGVSEALKCIKWAGKASADTHLCGSYRSAIKKREGNHMLWHVPQRFEDSSDLSLFPNEIVLWISTFNYQNPIKNGRKNDSLLLQRPLAVILMACPKCVIKTDIYFLSFAFFDFAIISIAWKTGTDKQRGENDPEKSRKIQHKFIWWPPCRRSSGHTPLCAIFC